MTDAEFVEAMGAAAEYKMLMQQAVSERDDVRRRLADAEARIQTLREAIAKDEDDICQTLGKVLGYPWYKDDQKNFPGATEADGVCVGEHVAASIAAEAARRVREVEEALHGLLSKNTRMRPVAEFENPDEWIVVTKSAFDFANAALARRTP